jgi:hypothetical protein
MEYEWEEYVYDISSGGSPGLAKSVPWERYHPRNINKYSSAI